MDDRVDLFAGKDVITELFIANIALIEPRLGMHGSPEASLQIVRNHDVVAVVNELVNRVAADVARAA